MKGVQEGEWPPSHTPPSARTQVPWLPDQQPVMQKNCSLCTHIPLFGPFSGLFVPDSKKGQSFWEGSPLSPNTEMSLGALGSSRVPCSCITCSSKVANVQLDMSPGLGSHVWGGSGVALESQMTHPPFCNLFLGTPHFVHYSILHSAMVRPGPLTTSDGISVHSAVLKQCCSLCIHK